MENFVRAKPMALGQYDKGILGVDVNTNILIKKIVDCFIFALNLKALK